MVTIKIIIHTQLKAGFSRENAHFIWKITVTMSFIDKAVTKVVIFDASLGCVSF